MKRLELERFAPVGYDWRGELRYFAGGLIAAFLYSLRFLIRLKDAQNLLYRTSSLTGQRVLREGMLMPDFAELIDRCLLAFPLVALMMVFFGVLHYAYHRRGCRCDYTMRRLPDPWELHRRCLTIPVCTVLICLIAGFVMLLIYYEIYMLTTPPECLTPGQWAKLWTMEVRS